MREAVSLAPNNSQVKAAFVKLQSDESVNALIRLCRRFARDNDEEAGKEALRYLNGSRIAISEATAEECIILISEEKDGAETIQKTRDEIVSHLLQHQSGARSYLAKRLEKSVTSTFREIYNIGDGSAYGIATVVLDPGIWSTESTRETCEADIFQLFLAKLMETGHDHDGRALKGIARILSADAKKLQTLIDEEVFDSFLTSFDNKLPPGIRSQATLATARYLEVSQETGHQYLSNFITLRLARQTNNDLVLAFSVAAAIFPLVPTIASALFLTEGFVPSLQPLIQKKSKSARVEEAALEMLNAACIDSACRESIAKHCLDWLHDAMQVCKEEDPQRQGLAAVILTKVITFPVSSVGKKDQSKSHVENENDDLHTDIIPALRRILLYDDNKTNRPNAIEGLAYASIQPRIKETLIKDSTLIKQVLTLSPTTDPSINTMSVFGSLTLLDNLSRYLPNLSDEQKRITQLKAYANASKNPAHTTDPLDEDTHVTKRCSILLQNGAVPFLVGIHKTLVATTSQLSQASLRLLASILLSLSKTPSSRGTIAQQGGIPLLLQIYKTPNESPPPSDTTTHSHSHSHQHLAAHALSRILISVNPHLVFGSRLPSSALPPLLSLLTPPDDSTSAITDQSPRDLLPVFESLLALTNLVSDPSLNTSAEVIRSAFSPQIEEFLLSNNTYIQRAATELVCNLLASSPQGQGIAKFADGSQNAKSRVHILLALTDVEDVATRRAAGGGLATLTQFEEVVKVIQEKERGVENLVRLCKDEDEACVLRGLVCLLNIVSAEGEGGRKAKEMVKAVRGVETLQEVIRSFQNPDVVESGIEALKAVLG